MKIITYPNSSLRQKAKKIKKNEIAELKPLIKEMIKLIKQKDGVGLAAPQVGKLIRLIVVATDKNNTLILINPKITRKSFSKEFGEEGCLSLPGIYGKVKRAKKIKICTYNLEGKKLKFLATEMFARILQHEIDHLKGILFIDRAKEITKGREILEKLNQ